MAALVEALGGAVDLTGERLTVRGRGVVNGGEIDLRDLGELTPTVAVLALLADAPDARSAASTTSGVTRPTGSPHSLPRPRASGATSR